MTGCSEKRQPLQSANIGMGLMMSIHSSARSAGAKSLGDPSGLGVSQHSTKGPPQRSQQRPFNDQRVPGPKTMNMASSMKTVGARDKLIRLEVQRSDEASQASLNLHSVLPHLWSDPTKPVGIGIGCGAFAVEGRGAMDIRGLSVRQGQSIH